MYCEAFINQNMCYNMHICFCSMSKDNLNARSWEDEPSG